MLRTKILVAASALMYAGFGWMGLHYPVWTLDVIHAAPKDATALNEIRAMYGGVQLGIAAFLVSCLLNRWSLQAGLFLVCTLFAGAAAARAKSFGLDGAPDATFIGIWIFEVVWAVACIVTLVREKPAAP